MTNFPPMSSFILIAIGGYSTCCHWWQVSHNKEGNQQSKRLIYSRSPVQQANVGNWHSAVLMRAWLLRFKNTKLFWYRYRTRLYLSAPSNLKNINSLKWSKPSQEAGQDMLSKPEQSSSFSFGATFSTFSPFGGVSLPLLGDSLLNPKHFDE